MRIIPNEIPTPRLLITAAIDHSWSKSAEAVSSGKLKPSGAWTGNAFAIFVGIALGSLLLCGASTFLITRYTTVLEESAAPRLVSVSAPPTVTTPTPAPLRVSLTTSEEISLPTPTPVQFGTHSFRVTAISLGHPRLAVINHQQVQEGDWIEAGPAMARTRVKLHVIKIADGSIELRVGDQVISVGLDQLKLKPL
jgi:hypothetical protein